MKILSIESSCDETAVAIVENGTTIRSSVVASSSQMHKKWGGIVPEIAAREQLRSILPVLSESLMQANLSLSHIDALAVTVGPGLIGSLLIGVETAKTLAFLTGKPLFSVNHVIAHTYANFVSDSGEEHESITFPAVSLVVSGGHTELYRMESPHTIVWLGGTIDDAAGEAFDKTARLLGFENRGGPAIEAAAKNFNIEHSELNIRLPRPYLPDQPYNFSFSGLKTAIMREVHALKEKQQINEAVIAHLAYEVQESITDVLVRKTQQAAERFHAGSILLSGGVAANSRLREKFNGTAHAPPPALCTDNAVTIGSCAFFLGQPADWRNIHANPNLSVEIGEKLHEMDSV